MAIRCWWSRIVTTDPMYLRQPFVISIPVQEAAERCRMETDGMLGHLVSRRSHGTSNMNRNQNQPQVWRCALVREPPRTRRDRLSGSWAAINHEDAWSAAPVRTLTIGRAFLSTKPGAPKR